MRTIRLILALLIGTTYAASAAPPPDYSRQVVEIYITYQTYQARRPWVKSYPLTHQALAVVVEGDRLLTSAQMVADATLIQAQKFGAPPKVAARLVHVDQEVNLALLKIDKPGFFVDLQPVRLADHIPTDGFVRSVRWNNGQLEVSSSRVSRIEVLQSRMSDFKHAFLRVKSDLVGGGWAEPLFSGERLVGLTVSQEEDLADIVPSEIIEAYLREVRQAGNYSGFGSIQVVWQINRDPVLASYLGLNGEPRGINLLQIPWGSSGCTSLKPRDLLLSLDGYAIDADGFYLHPQYGRLLFHHIVVDGHMAGDVVPAQVLRNREPLDLTVTLQRYLASAPLVPWREIGSAPLYLVAGGLLFRELDMDYLSSWGKNWVNMADSRLLAYWELERNAQAPDRRRIIVLTGVLPDPYNIGYHNLKNLVVCRINGRPVGSISDLVEGFRHPKDGFHVIGLKPNSMRTEIVLDAETFEEATTRILKNYGIPDGARLEKTPLPDLGSPCQGDG